MKFNKHNVNTYNTSIQTVNLNQDLISKCIILTVLVLNKTFFKNTYYYRSACTVYEQILRQTMDSLLRLKTYMLLFSIIANEKKPKMSRKLEELVICKVVPAILLNLTFYFRMRSIYEPVGTSSTILFMAAQKYYQRLNIKNLTGGLNLRRGSNMVGSN